MDVGPLYRDSLAEIERLIDAKKVVGEPILVEGTTLIPLFSIGFGFGAGGGTGEQGGQTGSGGGSGAGGGVKPVAVIIANAQGVRVERIGGGGLASLGEAIATVMKKAGEEED